MEFLWQTVSVSAIVTACKCPELICFSTAVYTNVFVEHFTFEALNHSSYLRLRRHLYKAGSLALIIGLCHMPIRNVTQGEVTFHNYCSSSVAVLMIHMKFT